MPRIERTIRAPVREHVQADGRIRRWAQIAPSPSNMLPSELIFHSSRTSKSRPNWALNGDGDGPWAALRAGPRPAG